MVIKISKYTSVFENANDALIMQYDSIPNSSQHRKNFEKQYNCEVVIKKGWGSWVNLIFDSKNEALMFILKWS